MINVKTEPRNVIISQYTTKEKIFLNSVSNVKSCTRSHKVMAIMRNLSIKYKGDRLALNIVIDFADCAIALACSDEISEGIDVRKTCVMIG